MRAFYNEIDRYCCDWLSNLMDGGLITPGKIDDRSIENLGPDDVRGYERVHFFAGIGGWDYALNLTNWGARPVWTGSCPCQPFSAAGKRQGFTDKRHLWPVWHRLIAQCRPSIIFGEQVAAAIRGGWLDTVFADLEAKNYACAAAVLPACSIGAPHIRQRCWFVADTRYGARGECREFQGTGRADEEASPDQGRDGIAWSSPYSSTACELADAHAPGRGEQRSGGLLDGEWAPQRHDTNGCGTISVDNTSECGRPQGRAPRSKAEQARHRSSDDEQLGNTYREREAAPGGLPGGAFAQRSRGPWTEAEWIACRDDKSRPVEPGTFPLVDGLSFRLGSGSSFEGKSRSSMLRGYGNAIVPQCAQAFIEAYMSVVPTVR